MTKLQLALPNPLRVLVCAAVFSVFAGCAASTEPGTPKVSALAPEGGFSVPSGCPHERYPTPDSVVDEDPVARLEPRSSCCSL